MKVTRQAHPGYEEHKKYMPEMPSLLGKWQYIYSSKKGEVSLIKLINYFRDGKDLWEIYSLKGDLFDDVERFYTKKDAEKEIKKLLK